MSKTILKVMLGCIGLWSEMALANCTVVGDSLAVGVAQHSPCVAIAKVGRTAKQILEALPPTLSDPVILSVGSNRPSLASDMLAIRQRMHGPVVWVYPPQNSEAQADVASLAARFSDSILAVRPEILGPDGLHPTGQGYQKLGRAAQTRWGAADCRGGQQLKTQHGTVCLTWVR